MKKTLILTLLASTCLSGTSFAGGKIRLEQGHTDMDVAFEEGAFELLVHDGTNDLEYDPKKVTLQVNSLAQTFVPDAPAYSFLGLAGAPVWILPSVQTSSLLFLGIGGEEVEPGIFQNDAVSLSLLGVHGPGEFALYSIDPFGVPQVAMNSRDGIAETDRLDVAVGGHSDFNWAFSKPGNYRITVEASGTLPDGSVISSGPVTYTFRVLRSGQARP